MLLARGTKIRFESERLRYTVRVASDRFAVCTKPFNPRHTVLYTIIDFERDVRGPEDLIFGCGFETDAQCLEALVRLTLGESAVSYRHCIPLDMIEPLLKR